MKTVTVKGIEGTLAEKFPDYCAYPENISVANHSHPESLR
jgi:hypothetical protein